MVSKVFKFPNASNIIVVLHYFHFHIYIYRQESSENWSEFNCAPRKNNLFSFFCLSPVQPDANQSSPVQHRVLCQACSTRFLHFCFPSSFDWLIFDVLCRPRHPIRTGLRPGGAEWYKMKGLLCKQPVQSKRKICTPFIPLSQSAWWLRNSNFLHFLFYRVCVCVCVFCLFVKLV